MYVCSYIAYELMPQSASSAVVTCLLKKGVISGRYKLHRGKHSSCSPYTLDHRLISGRPYVLEYRFRIFSIGAL